MKTSSCLKLAGALLLAMSLGSLAKADPINGDIYFAPTTTAQIDFTANTVTFAAHPDATVYTANGTYVGMVGSTVNIPDFNYNAGPAQEIWRINAGTYFVVDNWVSVTENATDGGLLLWGAGTAYLTGYDATPGVFTFSSSRVLGTEFSFSSVTTVPDGGTTALLVGLGLVGMSFVSRRRK